MSIDNEEWFDTWWLRAIAGSLSTELKDRYGVSDHYTVDQVMAACDARNLQGPSRGCALAMFCHSEETGDLLAHYGITEPAEAFRTTIAQKIAPRGGYLLGSSASFHDLASGDYSFGSPSDSCGGASGGDGD